MSVSRRGQGSGASSRDCTSQLASCRRTTEGGNAMRSNNHQPRYISHFSSIGSRIGYYPTEKTTDGCENHKLQYNTPHKKLCIMHYALCITKTFCILHSALCITKAFCINKKIKRNESVWAVVA